METMDDVLILGGGPAGCTAALYAARSALKTRILEKLAPGGQMATTDHIDNYPGFPEGIEGYALGSRMEQQAVQFGAQITVGEAVGVSLEGKVKTVEIADGTLLKARTVIVAPGASPRELGLPKEAEFRGRGVSYCATCDGAFYRGKRVAVVGGGDTAAVDALFLSRICRQVILVHRRGEMRAAKAYRQRLEAAENVEFVWNSEVTALTAGDRIEGITVRSRIDGSTQAIPCDGVFIAVGTVPNTQLFRGILDMDEAGYLSAGEDTRTNLSGVFAVGDARRKPLRQVLTAAADGAVAAYMAEEYLMRDSRDG